MGCDIHAYIEYKRKDDSTWWNFGSRINPGRNYHAFSKLCGVRSYGDEFVSKPKGRLYDWATTTQWEDRIWISDREENGERSVNKQTAEDWVKRGISHYVDSKVSSEHTWVTNPDHHSHSWATTDEWEAACKGSGAEYNAMIAAMRSLEEQGNDARVVYWFDN